MRCTTLLQGDLNNVRDEIMKFKVGAPARVGLVAPNSVEVPAGGTGLDPSSTNFFQVLATNSLPLPLTADAAVKAPCCLTLCGCIRPKLVMEHSTFSKISTLFCTCIHMHLSHAFGNDTPCW